MEKIRIGFVDDQRLFRVGFARILASFENMELVLVAENGADLLAQLQEKSPLEIILIDLDMPGMNGIQVAKILKEQYPEVKAIILTGHDDDALIVKLLQDNFCAYLHKDAHETEVEQTIMEVAANGKFVTARALEALNHRKINPGVQQRPELTQDQLTAAEVEIIKLICKGLTNEEIADQLHKGVRTVQNQRLALRKKIDARNTADLINYAMKHKLIDDWHFPI